MLSVTFGLSVNAVLWTFRIALFVVPPLVGWATWALCRELVRPRRRPARIAPRDPGRSADALLRGGAYRRQAGRPRQSDGVTSGAGLADEAADAEGEHGGAGHEEPAADEQPVAEQEGADADAERPRAERAGRYGSSTVGRRRLVGRRAAAAARGRRRTRATSAAARTSSAVPASSLRP